MNELSEYGELSYNDFLRKLAPPMPRDHRPQHGWEIKWTNFNGSRHSVWSGWYDKPEDALRSVLRIAKATGWKPRKWWQWWRWNDTPLRDPLPHNKDSQE